VDSRFALDVWAVKNILVPQMTANGYTELDYGTTQDPETPLVHFENYLDRSMSELLLAGSR